MAPVLVVIMWGLGWSLHFLMWHINIHLIKDGFFTLKHYSPISEAIIGKKYGRLDCQIRSMESGLGRGVRSVCLMRVA